MGVLAPISSRRRIKRIPKAKRKDVRREKYNALVDILNGRGRIIETMEHALDLQFRRIAQIQAELDQIKGTWSRMKFMSKGED